MTDFFGPSDKGTTPGNVSSEQAPESTAWRGPTLSDFTSESFDSLSAAQRSKIARHFAWAEKMPPESFGQLKLPHHRARDGWIVLRGVNAAMGALLGARGGVAIPDGDRRSVYNHLAAHIRAFDREPPEFREYTEAEVKEIFKEKTLVEKVPTKWGIGHVIKASDEPGSPIRFRFTERKVDRDREVIESAGVDLTYFKQNPVIFWLHGRGDYDMSSTPMGGAFIPIGHALTGLGDEPDTIKQTKTFIDGDILFDPLEVDPFAAMIEAKYRRRTLNAVSIGFVPVITSKEPVFSGQTGDTYVTSELLEVSGVPLPSLRSALARRDFDDLVSKCAEYDHPLPISYIDLVQNFMDDNAPEIPKVNGDLEYRLRAALVGLDMTIHNITRPR